MLRDYLWSLILVTALLAGYTSLVLLHKRQNQASLSQPATLGSKNPVPGPTTAIVGAAGSNAHTP